jgi:hypothetical protein
MLRKLFCILAFVTICSYLWFGRSQWFDTLEENAKIGADALYSRPIDLSRPGEVEWALPLDQWSYREGETRLSLVLDRISGESPRLTSSTPINLRLRVSADATPTRGVDTSGPYDRLIRNWYFTTDRPLDADSRLWSSWGDKQLELGLAGIMRYPFDQITVKLEILAPDSVLSGYNPRLKLVGAHDYAVYEHLPLLRLIRDGGLFTCAILLLGLTGLAWRTSSRPTRET